MITDSQEIGKKKTHKEVSGTLHPVSPRNNILGNYNKCIFTLLA